MHFRVTFPVTMIDRNNSGLVAWNVVDDVDTREEGIRQDSPNTNALMSHRIQGNTELSRNTDG